MGNKSEILINSSQVTHQDFGDAYEFVLNDEMRVIECIKVNSLAHGIITPVEEPTSTLDGFLFELNHVRVNPRVDNSHIIECLTGALMSIGVNVLNSPDEDSMEMCFKPLGEISDNVRFYIGQSSKLIFLSPATKPKLVNVQNLQQGNMS